MLGHLGWAQLTTRCCVLPPVALWLWVHQIEHAFASIRAVHEEMPGFHYSAFTKKRTDAQILQVSRQVLRGVQRGVKPGDIRVWETRCSEFHSACKEGMPIYDVNAAPSCGDVNLWKAARGDYLAEFKGEDQDSETMATAYRSRMGLLDGPTRDSVLDRAKASLKRQQCKAANQAADARLADAKAAIQRWNDSMRRAADAATCARVPLERCRACATGCGSGAGSGSGSGGRILGIMTHDSGTGTKVIHGQGRAHL